MRKCLVHNCAQIAVRDVAYVWNTSKGWGWTVACFIHAQKLIDGGAIELLWEEGPIWHWGPASAELRADGESPSIQSSRAYRLWQGARASLERQGYRAFDNADVASEAIEAAESLAV